MTYEKHTTHTDALDTLGSIIDDTQKRDAIHLAVEPVIAGEFLDAGEHVRLAEDGTARRCRPGDGVGIVDPFVTDIIEEGDWIWLVVYPRQISSLRHVWEHPSFPPSGETADEYVKKQDAGPSPRDYSEQWLRDYIANSSIDTFTLEEVVEAVESGRSTVKDDDFWLSLDDNEYLISHGADAYGAISPEFFTHLEVYLGHPPARRASYFSCSC